MGKRYLFTFFHPNEVHTKIHCFFASSDAVHALLCLYVLSSVLILHLFFFHLQLHTFPEGKICQDNAPIGRLKWGVASLIAKARVQPIVLPVCHSGFEKVSIFVPLSIISMSIYTLSSLIIVQYLFAFVDISHW